MNLGLSLQARSRIDTVRERAFYELGQAHGVFAKTAGEASKVYVLSGELYASASGWVLLRVPNAIVRGLFDALDENGAELPLTSDGRLNGHITVLRPDDVEKIGGIDRITELGHHFKWQMGPVKEVTLNRAGEVSKVWACFVESPELAEFRRAYGLSSLPVDDSEPFHLTFARRRKKALHAGDEVVKQSSTDLESRSASTFAKQASSVPVATPTQQEEATCGPVALRAIDPSLSEKELEQEANTTQEGGTTPEDLAQAAQKKGLQVVSKGTLTLDQLKEHINAGKVVVCPVQWTDDDKLKDKYASGHYTTVCGFSDGKIHLTAGEGEFHELPEEEFLRIWHDKDKDGKEYKHYGIVISTPDVDTTPTPGGLTRDFYEASKEKTEEKKADDFRAENKPGPEANKELPLLEYHRRTGILTNLDRIGVNRNYDSNDPYLQDIYLLPQGSTAATSKPYTMLANTIGNVYPNRHPDDAALNDLQDLIDQRFSVGPDNTNEDNILSDIRHRFSSVDHFYPTLSTKDMAKSYSATKTLIEDAKLLNPLLDNADNQMHYPEPAEGKGRGIIIPGQNPSEGKGFPSQPAPSSSSLWNYALPAAGIAAGAYGLYHLLKPKKKVQQEKVAEDLRDLLYHGSSIPGLQQLQPKPSRVLDNEEAVFATPNRDVALSFAAPWRDNDLEHGSVNGQFYMREQYPDAFNKLYKGKPGSIYSLPAAGFSSDPRLTKSERVHKHPVSVTKEERIKDLLKALKASQFLMLNYGQKASWEDNKKDN